jgi:DNA (cytosine-5)-methyltransferase 1
MANNKKQNANIAVTTQSLTLPVVLSLFSGAGGLDLGFKRAGFEIKLAIDSEASAISTHAANFSGATGLAADLVALGAEGVLAALKNIVPAGSRIGVIGGPPCQGFSRANTRSKKLDPRNKLPTLYVKIIKELQAVYAVDFFIFENVLGIRDAPHVHRYRRLLSALRALDFEVEEQEFCALDFGVPQNRRRIIISGIAKGKRVAAFIPERSVGKRTVREGIGDIQSEPIFFQKGRVLPLPERHPNHWTMAPISEKFKNPDQLSADKRSFKRLRWDFPSPTVAYGNREIHVHPSGTRRLSIFEAMRLQGFPDEFVIKGNLSAQVKQISNAVPPPMAEALAHAVKRALSGQG